MSIRILTKNGVDNTNIDGARDNNFNSGRRSGILKGGLKEGNLYGTGNTLVLESCELRLCGHRVIIDSAESITLYDTPVNPYRQSLIAQIQVDKDKNVSFDFIVQDINTKLIQDNLDLNGSGTYQLEIGKFTLLTNGNISDVVRTADLITGGLSEGAIKDIKFNANAIQLPSGYNPEVNVDFNEQTGEYDIQLGIPAGSGSRVTIGGVEQASWSADFAEDERQKSKNLIPFPYTYVLPNESGTSNGVTFAVNADSSINISGTNNSSTSGSQLILVTDITLKAGTYTCSVSHNDGFYIETPANNWFKFLHVGQTSNTFTLTEDLYCPSIYVLVPKGGSIDTSNVFIQLERGSTATDWHEYNGEIIHKKDVADVEHIETIYSMSSSQSIINLGYTSGIIGGTEISGLDLSKYKRIKVYVTLDKTNGVFDIDLTKKVYSVQEVGYSYVGGINTPIDLDLRLIYADICRVSDTKTAFKHYSSGYIATDTGTYNERNNSAYFVYKIEGVV